MSRMIAVFVVSVFIAVSVSGVAWSQHGSSAATSKEPAAQKAPEGKQMLADVVKVDQKAKSIVVKSKTGEKKIDISTADLAGYQSMADIKPGDKIAVLYNDKGGKAVAKAIANHSAMMKPQPAAK